MSTGQFTETLEQALYGKYVRVQAESGTFEGWAADVQHDDGSIVLYDATKTTTEESLGSVYIRTCDVVEVIKPQKQIEFVVLEDLAPYPEYDMDFTPNSALIQHCYRHQSPSEFPVIRENGTIITGHEQVVAAEIAGLQRVPAEIIAVTDQQAAELFRIAHGSEAMETPDSTPESADTAGDAADTPEEAQKEADDDSEDNSGPAFGY